MQSVSNPHYPRPPESQAIFGRKKQYSSLAHLFDLVNKHQLGDDARLDTVDGAKGISLKVRSVIGNYAIGSKYLGDGTLFPVIPTRSSMVR
jgi:hypothetical protein